MRIHVLFSCILLSACASDPVATFDGSIASDSGLALDASSEAQTPFEAGKPDAFAPCHSTPQNENADRAVAISHPFGGDSGKSGLHEVLKLTSDGNLVTTGVTFSLGEASRGNIVFTPDGAVGLIALEGGHIGSFLLGTDLKATVAEASFAGSFYGAKLLMSPDGSSVWVLNPATIENAGSLSEVAIACDGRLSETGRKISSSSMFAGTVANVSPFQLLVAAKSVTGSQPGSQVHLLDLSGSSPSYVRGGTVFSDADAIPSAMAVVGDHALIADDSIIAGNRIGAVDTATLKPVQELSIKYPSAVVASPYGNAALTIASDTVAKVYAVSYDKTKAKPFSASEMKYTLAKPSLPQFAAMVTRGTLKGHAVITETTGVRQVAFDSSGNLTDVTLLPLGSGATRIVGSIGVQP